MATVNIKEAKTRFSELLRRVEDGEEVTIARNGNPVAKLVRLTPNLKRKRQFGALKGNKTWQELSDVVLQPLPPEELELWEGGP